MLEGNLTIGDPNDGLLARYPADNPSVKMTFKVGALSIPLHEASLSIRGPERFHGVHCTMGVEPMLNGDGMLDIRKTINPHLANPRLREFGPTLLFLHDTVQYIERFTKALASLGYGVSHGPVQYHPMRYAGPMGPFTKLESHAYQREYRFLTDRPIPETLDVELGSLEDISSPFTIPPQDDLHP